jgi:hypothetical protein
MTMRFAYSYCAAVLFAGAGCVDSTPPPDLLAQGVVTYGDRVYVVDASFSPSGNDRDSQGICTRLTTLLPGNSAGIDDTPQDLIDDGTLAPTDGQPLTGNDLNQPQNCFIPMTTPPAGGHQLQVDSFEVTNSLYQFCVDSGFCEEPDPSDIDDQGGVCIDDEDGFFDCPMLAVSQNQAQLFCSFIGRRLPTALESIIIRQHGWAADANGTRPPESFLPFPAVSGPDDEPVGCTEAFLGGFDCGLPRTLEVGGSSPEGAAALDSVETESPLDASEVNLVDLTGHVAEWSADGFTPPGSRGIADPQVDLALPWFCLLPATLEANTGIPVCPSLPGPGEIPPEFEDELGNVFAACAFAYYDPDLVTNLFVSPPPNLPDRPYGLYPLCLTSFTGGFSGSEVALFGGSWRDGGADVELGGVFARRVEPDADDFTDADLAEGYGFRCVDDRDSGDPNFASTGTPVPSLPVDADFMP